MADGSILTTIGTQKLASATPLDQVNITELAVGDGSGGYPTLDPSMTALVNEVWRGAASTPIRDPENLNILIFEALIPPSEGGFYVREIALFDDEGDMIAIGQTPEIEKPAPGADQGVSLTIRMYIALDNADQVTLVYSGGTGTADHSGLGNRDAFDAHPQLVGNLLNVTELRSTPGVIDDQQVSVLGNDGRGWMQVYWDADSTESDDDQNVFSVTGVTQGRWKKTAEIKNRTIYVGSVAESFSVLSGISGQLYNVIAWHPGGAAEVAPKGGGGFVYMSDVPRTSHDGGYIISPTVPALSAQSGADLDARIANFLDGAGETDPVGTGCYVRVRAGEYENEANVCQFGGKTDRTTDVAAIISRMLHLNLPVVMPAGQHAWLSTLTITDQDGFWLKGVGYQTVVVPDLTGDAIKIRTEFEKEGVIIENMRVSNRGTDIVPARTDTPTNFVSINGFPHNRLRNVKFQRFDCTNSIIKNEKAYGCSLERIRCYQCRVGLAFWELNQLPDDSVEQSYMSDGYDIDVTGLTTEGAATDAYAFYFEGGMLELDKVVVQSSQHVFAYGANNTVNPTMLFKNVYVENNDGYILQDLGGSAAGSPPMIDINGWRDVASNTNHLYDLGSGELKLKQWRSTTPSENYAPGNAKIRIDAPSRYTNQIMKSGAGFIGTPDRAKIINGTAAADLPFSHAPGDVTRWSSFLVMLSRPAQGGYRTITDVYHVTVNQESSVVATRISRVDGGESSGSGSLPDWTFSLSDGVVQVAQSQGGSYTAQICSNNSYAPTP